MTVRSYAKINLGLRLLRKRPDGYHDLETVFHRVDFFDEIDFVLSDGKLTLETDRVDLPTDSGNLCIRAAELMRGRAPAGVGVRMALHKRIPMGAGLGGGSSDAASVLLALKDLWSVPISDAEMMQLALTLGSDVPYFLRPGSAIARGRGEVLEPIPLEIPYWIVVAVPPLSVSTAWAYQNVQLRQKPGPSLKDLLTRQAGGSGTPFAGLTNDFEQLVLKEYPLVHDLKRKLSESGALLSLMSGSGSAVFGLFVDEQAARHAMESLAKGQHTVSLTQPGFSPPVPHILRK